MSDYKMMARVYSLIAEMEALKVEIEVLKSEWAHADGGGAHLFQEKADLIRGIASELQLLGH